MNLVIEALAPVWGEAVAPNSSVLRSGERRQQLGKHIRPRIGDMRKAKPRKDLSRPNLAAV